MFFIICTLLVTTAPNPLSLVDDSVEVVIRNEIEGTPITAVHYLVAGSGRMHQVTLNRLVDPGESLSIRLPFRYMSRIVFGTDASGNYRRVSFAPSPLHDTLAVSRADREFGGFFDVILGDRPYAVQNSSPVPIASVHLTGQGLPEGSIIGSNPLMTGETLIIWLSSDSVSLTATDSEGNTTGTIRLLLSERDSLHTISTADFVDSILLSSEGQVHIVSGLNGELIVGIEVYPVHEDPFFIDLEGTPLALWESVGVPVTDQVGFLVCVDSNGRTYSLDRPEPGLDAYVVNWWHLDFDFSFPGRTN